MYYRSMAVRDIKVYFRSLFEALAAVHKSGIIHRDIKPTYDVHIERTRERKLIITVIFCSMSDVQEAC